MWRVNSIGGSRYFITFIDDKSGWCEIYFIKKKSEAASAFFKYKAMVENQLGKRIKCLRSDNGTEYLCNELESYLKKHGIKHEMTVAYTPEQNDVAERRNRTLVEMARCMMIQSQLSPSFWAEAISTANI
jgi:transposase InsO family protein